MKLVVLRSIVAASCLLSSVSQVAKADDAAQARYHDDLARGHYAAGRFDLALREFFLEQQLAPNPRILFNIAVCFESLGQEGEAFTFFADYLADPSDTEEGRRSHASAAVARLSARVARVAVVTDPPGATIFVDRRELGAYGVSPRTLALEPGEHRIWVELPGYHPAEARLTVSSGGQAPFEVHLERVVAALHVEGPAGASVEVVDERGTVVASGAAPLDASLPPAHYEVRLRAEGRRPWSGEVRLPEAGARLEPPLDALPEPTGELTVTASSQGAIVELDGELAGFAPVVLGDLSTGLHTLRVRREGLLEWSGDVRVEDGRRTWTTVTLEEPGHVTRSPVSYVLSGTGAAAMLTSVVLYGLAARGYNRYEDAVTRVNPVALPRDTFDSARRLDRAGSVLLAAGGLQLAAGVTLYFSTRHVEVRPSSASSQVSE